MHLIMVDIVFIFCAFNNNPICVRSIPYLDIFYQVPIYIKELVYTIRFILNIEA